MKNSTSLIICILICLVPTFLAGQALQVQNQLTGHKAPLRSLQLNSMQPLTGSPLLRISNIGSSGQDGVSIQLNSQSLTDPGPSLLFDVPVPGTAGSGAMRLLPNEGNPFLRVTNIGSSGQDGVKLSFGNPPVLNSFFDVFYDLSLGTETHMSGDPDFDLLRITSYDKVTPKLLDRVMSTHLDSFFDVFYDLNLAVQGVGFGFDPDDLCLVNKFDLDPPSLQTKIQSSNPLYLNSFFDITYELDLGTIRTEHENLVYTVQYRESDWDFSSRISSEDPLVPSFFDISYDLNLGQETHMHGDPDFDLLRITSYDKATPRLDEKILSTHLDSFFDVFYDLSLATTGVGFGFEPDDLCMVQRFDLDPPTLQTKIQSSNPLYLNSFFDITYRLDSSFLRTAHKGLVRTEVFDSTIHRFHTNISSNLPSIPSFFDVFYDLPLAIQGTGFGNNPDNLCMVYQYNVDPPKLNSRIESSKPLYHNSFFDITYRLDSSYVTTAHKGLARKEVFDSTFHLFRTNISSNVPAIPSFFDITYDLNLKKETHELGAIGDPDFDLLRITSYDNTNSKLKDSILTHKPSVASFFDISYDLALQNETHQLGTPGDPDFDLLRITSYDKTKSKLKDSIITHRPSVQSFFDISYDLSLGQETRKHGKLDSVLVVTRTYDKATPKLSESIASRLLEEEGIFYFSHNLHTGEEIRQYGDPDFDLLVARTYDLATPKLDEKISSNNPQREGYFQLYHDLRLGTESRAFRAPVPLLPGDPDFDLIHIRTYDRVTPKLQETISSTNPSLLNSFFDITYDIGARAAKVQFEDILITRSYDPLLPKIQERLSDVNADNFLDIITSLDAGTEAHVFGDLASDIRVVRTYDKSAHTLNDRILDSSLPPASFFDITYNMSPAGGGGATGKVQFQDFHFTKTFDAATPKLLEHVASSKPGFENSFFDITYDLQAQFYKVKFNDLLVTSYFIPSTPKFEQKISSSLLPYIESFFDITYDISDIHKQVQSTKAFGAGVPLPLEMRYEYDAYDALSRRIREVSTDLNNGASLTLERRLSPTGSSLFVSSKMEIQGPIEVQGSVSTPGAGPLTIADNVMINGTAHQINGSVVITGPANQVNGNLHVTGTLTAGMKLFTIDHPLDPENKYLIHSCVESPDMMNVYNGNTITNDQGYVTVTLPDYFEALNTDFRYQLTCMGQFAQAIITEKIKDNKFVIRTDKPNVEVSWQVTGVRNDPAANRNNYAVEVEKEPEMKGTLLYVKQ